MSLGDYIYFTPASELDIGIKLNFGLSKAIKLNQLATKQPLYLLPDCYTKQFYLTLYLSKYFL